MPAHARDDPGVTQVGTYDYFVSPNYTGLALVASVITNQTLGLGTFDHLDGELVVVGGVAARGSSLSSAGLRTWCLEQLGITVDRTTGGHVLSCAVGNDLQLSVQRAAGFKIF